MQLTLKKLAGTDLLLSPLGLGTVKLGRNTDVKYPQDFNIPDDKQAADLLALAREMNINVIDTAPAYGDSELRLGKLLQGQRDRWIIVGKAGEEYVEQKSYHDFRPMQILASIKRSLQRLNTDYIDILLIHSDGDDEQIINQYEVFETLNIAKQQGLIRYSGMSTKTVTGGLLTLQHADVAMVMYNPVAVAELPVIQAAAQQQKGILIKKAFASGHLNKIAEVEPIETALQFIFAQSGIGSVILGTINPQHLTENVRAAINSLSPLEARKSQTCEEN